MRVLQERSGLLLLDGIAMFLCHDPDFIHLCLASMIRLCDALDSNVAIASFTFTLEQGRVETTVLASNR